uniref:RRM domain-containing protein n=1 Tax=Poecilia formosa TaxID=48698 RepID=A0A096M856_POEFO
SDIGNMGNRPGIFISVPKKYWPVLSQFYDLDHGLFITDLNPNISEGYVAAYFKPFGCVTMCKVESNIKNSSGSSKDRLAYVRFSTEAEANEADWAGPHFIGGTECKVRRVVSPKVRRPKTETLRSLLSVEKPGQN